MATEQLERSFLERKEREELHAIAAALSLKVPVRLKKADIVNLILQATGVVANGDADKAVSAPGGNGKLSLESPNGHAAPGFGQEAIVAVPDGETSDDVRSSGDVSTLGDIPKKRTRKPKSEVSDSLSRETSDSSAAITDALYAAQAPLTSGDTKEIRQVQNLPAESIDKAVSGAEVPSGDTKPSSGGDEVKREESASVPPETGSRKSRRRRGKDRDRSDTSSANGDAQWQGDLVPVRGLLDLKEDGYGFLRTTSYLASAKDVYVSVSQVRRFGLRKGDAVEGACRPAASNEKYPALIRIDTIGGLPAEASRNRPKFEDLTPLFPDEPLRLELSGNHLDMTSRIIDLISPIGKGQRGMIVSPPKAGKTTIMKEIARSIETNNPDVHLMVLLVDERPEEVTDMRRSVKGEVVASTFDRPSEEHAQVAELTIERAKRLVELGKDVVIILDGITRLARAYNMALPATGRIMSGGVDSGALYPPKKFFGAARNVEEGGSLTILATALVETGSKMDEVIFEEFKGTGNMELRLDRKLAERRLYPAIDVNSSSTRHEELLFERNQLQQVWKLRRVLNAISGDSNNAAAGLELLLDKLKSTRSNEEFLGEIAKAPIPN
jgi:transcription termination factor Rho